MKKEISKIFKSGPYSDHHAPQNLQQVAVVGTTVILGRKHPELDGILATIVQFQQLGDQLPAEPQVRLRLSLSTAE